MSPVAPLGDSYRLLTGLGGRMWPLPSSGRLPAVLQRQPMTTLADVVPARMRLAEWFRCDPRTSGLRRPM